MGMAEQVNTEEILYQIITDRRYLSATDDDGETVDLMVRSLTPTERARAEFIYNRAMRKARKNKLPTEKQCMIDAISSGWWTKDKEKLIRLRYAELDRIEKEREHYKHNKGKQIKYRTARIVATKALDALLEEQASLCAHSAESYARTERANYVLSRITLSVDGIPRWKTYEDFLQQSCGGLLNSLVAAYNKIEAFTEKQIRAVARSSGWSIMWNASKKCGDPLFNKSSTEYSSEQSLLCYWSLMYDSVYESMEKPDDKIIEDDKALDKWFIDQRKKTKATARASASDDVFRKHSPGGASQQEEFVMISSEEEGDDVYDMNDKWSLARIRKETRKIEESDGGLDEFSLRGKRIKTRLRAENSSKFAEENKRIARESQTGYV
jgi:hypothetical protein